MKRLQFVLFVLFIPFLSLAQVQIETEGQIQSKALADSISRVVYVDSAGIFTVGQGGDRIVLRDSLGNVRFILDANTGNLRAIAGDTTWYQLEVNSPSRTVEKLDNGFYLEKRMVNDQLESRIWRLDDMGDTVCLHLDIIPVVVKIIEIDNQSHIYGKEESFYDSTGQVKKREIVALSPDDEMKTITLYYAEGETSGIMVECPDGFTRTFYGSDSIRVREYLFDAVHRRVIGQIGEGKEVKVITDPKEQTQIIEGLLERIILTNLHFCNTYTDPESEEMWKSIITPGEYKKETKTNGDAIEWILRTQSPDDFIKMEVKPMVSRSTHGNDGKSVVLEIDPVNSQMKYLFSDTLCHYWLNGNGDTFKVVVTPVDKKLEVKGAMQAERFKLKYWEVWEEWNNMGEAEDYKLMLGNSGTGQGMELDPADGILCHSFTDTLNQIWKNDAEDTICITLSPSDNKVIVKSDLEVLNDLTAKGDLNLQCSQNPSDFATFTWVGGKLQFLIGSGTGTDVITFDPANDSITINSGKVRINGDLEVSGTKNFVIDHPLDSDNKRLYHACVEGPERFNVYSGNVVTDENGYAMVDLPDYFEALNRDYRYQLTTIGSFARAIIREEITDNRFVIQTEEPNVKVSWEVTGVRNDKYARENPMRTVVSK